MTDPRGLRLGMGVYVYINHTGDSVTRWSRTGFVVFLNEAPIYNISKEKLHEKQVPLEVSLLQLSKLLNMSEDFVYKIRMFGIPCEDPTFVYGNNQHFLANISVPVSTLNKKYNSSAFHFLQEGCASDERRNTYVNTHENPADLLTHPLPLGEKMWRFIMRFLYWS